MLRQVLNRLRTASRKLTNRTVARAAFRKRLFVESLEERRLLASDLVYRADVDFGSGPFQVYNVQANAWTTLGSIDTSTQLAVSRDNDLYMLEQGTNTIKRYNAVANSWTSVMAGPPTNITFGGNLEVTNDGNFLITSSGSNLLWHTVSGGWSSVSLPGTASALGDYEHSTGTYAVSASGSEVVWRISIPSFSITTFSNGATGTNETRRFGEIYNQTWYTEYATFPIRRISLTSPSNTYQNASSSSPGFYASAAVNESTGAFYVNPFSNTQFQRWDSSTNTYTTLASAPSTNGHNSLAFVRGTQVEVDLNGTNQSGINFSTAFTEDGGPVPITDSNLTVTAATSSGTGDIFAANIGGGTVTRVNAATGAQIVFSSGGILSNARDLEFEANGNLLVADVADRELIRIDRATGNKSTLTSGGNFINPWGIEVVGNGDIFVTDISAGTIIRVNPVTGVQSVLRSGLASPSGIALDPQGDFVVIELNFQRVLRIDSVTGSTLQTISVGDKLSGGASYGIAVAPNGVIYATDFSTYNGGVFVNSSGSVIRIDPITGVQTHVTVGGNLTDPYDIEIDGNGDLIVSDYNGNGTGRIVRVNPNTGAQTLISTAGNLVGPLGLDVDGSGSSQITSAAVTITNLLDGTNESLALITTGTNITSSYNSVTGVLSLTGNDTAERYRQVLQSATYNNASQAPNTTTRLITVVVNSGANQSATATSTLSVNSVNDAPSGTSTVLVTNEDTTLTIAATDFGFSDIDGNAFNRVKITTLPTAGTLNINGVAVVAGGFVTKAQLDANQLTFDPIANANGSPYTTFTFQVEDDGGIVNGGVDLDQSPETISINVLSVNDSPIVATTDVTGAVTELGAPTGNLTDSGTISFTDVDLTDVHSIDGTITASSGALGALTASVTTDTTGSGLGGVITWNYTVAASAVEYLAAGQTKVETFSITLNDGNGGSVARLITVTITGTNDTPIVATTDVTGAVTELGAPTGNLTDSGTISFTDVDLTDVHSIDGSITASSGALGALTASVTTDTTGSGLGGVITWNYSVAASAVEYLAAGQTKVETFSITLNDGNGGSVARLITVTITSTNDTPIVATTDVTGAVTELGAPTGNLTDSGMIGFTDVDLTDVHSINGSITGSVGALGALTASVTTDTTGSGTGGVITWNYTLAASLVEYLAAGQTEVETFSIMLNDGNGGTVARLITVTITGTNDTPIVATTDVTGAVTELGAPTGNLTDSGMIGFTDVDLTDVHSINGSITGSVGALGSLSASVTADTTGSGVGGVITWNYTVAASAVEYLAAGQTKVETFSITLNDGNGGSVARLITVTITGTNDTPIVATTDVTGAVTELGAPTGNLTDSGMIGFTDVDLTDVHSINGSITGSVGALGTLTASVTTDTTGSGVGGVITWNYSVAAAAVEYLAAGQTKEETFSITFNDDNGGTVDRLISVTIAGTNDTPVVDSTDVTGAVTELGAPTGNLTDSGVIGFTDVDLTDVHSINGSITGSVGALGSLTASVTTDTTGSGLGGVITWNYTVAASVVEYLAAGQTKVETFSITLNDGNGGTVARLITVTITGTNDTPIVATTDVTGAVTELGAPTGNLTDSGAISFTDVDLTDVHSIDGSITASSGALGALTASVTTDTTGSGTGGVITWNYTVAASAVEYLAAGQTKVETFSIMLNDGNGGTVARLITVTITGTNDTPVVATTDVTGAVTEVGAPTGNLTDSGMIGFTDVDLTDVHSINGSITGSVGALGALTASVTTDTTGSGTGGVITWNYTVAASAIEYLAAGQTKVETFSITLNDGNGGTVARLITVTITGTNDTPRITMLSATSVQENGFSTLSGSYSDADSQDLHQITINWGEGTPVTFPVSGGTFSFTHQYLDDNPTNSLSDVYTIGVKLTDDYTGTDIRSTTTTITNVNPHITGLSNTSPEVGDAAEGQSISITGSFTDVGIQDTHKAIINWGDGTVPAIGMVASGGIMSGSHTYASGGIFTITVTLTDDDGGSVTSTTTAVITGVGVVGNTLYVIGTDNDDRVTINQAGSVYKVHADFLATGNFRDVPLAGISRIVVQTGDGSDQVTISGGVTLPALIDGGEGDDKLNGGNGLNIILGGGGNDQINGGSARDILIGGTGADRIVGNGDEDILIAGWTDHDAFNPTSYYDPLWRLMNEWSSSATQTIRRSNLTGATAGGLNGSVLLNSTTVHDDSDVDKLTGSSGIDWFFANLSGGLSLDSISDKTGGEFWEEL